MEDVVLMFKTRWFDRWARRQGLTMAALCAAVSEMLLGLHDANLGGGLFKKRIARRGRGKSDGFRTLVASNHGNRWFFVFGFAKSERDNIDANEEAALKKLAEHLLGLTPQALSLARRAGELVELDCRGQN